jgi:hypothetical protein
MFARFVRSAALRVAAHARISLVKEKQYYFTAKPVTSNNSPARC